MQVVIDIPDEVYKAIKNSTKPLYYVEHLIKEGIPLPKGHGRIIDENEITQVEFETIEEDLESHLQGTIIHQCQVFKGTDAPTIIKADKEE